MITISIKMGSFGRLILLSQILVFASSDPYIESPDLYDESNSAAVERTYTTYPEIELLEKILFNILISPLSDDNIPIVYIEDPADSEYNDKKGAKPASPPALTYDNEFTNNPDKRTRYYRRYPGKRQNSRYEATNRYLCQPSREDLFRLLVTLHSSRQLSKGQTVDFCNRKRPATSIFTNIRFVG